MPGALRAQEVEVAERLQKAFESAFEQVTVPGISAAFAVDGEIVWAAGLGRRSVDAEPGAEPVGTRTLFQAASISKPVTALAVLRLCEQGKLELDTPVAELPGGLELPRLEGSGEAQVTLRQLLSHTAGVTVHGFPGYPPDGKVPSLDEVLAGKGNTAVIAVDTEPGSAYRYSGGGYCLVQRVLAAAGEKDFAKLLHDEVLEPAGMLDSTFAQPLPASRAAQAARAHDGDGAAFEYPCYVYPELAAAGLWTTPTDLLRLLLKVEAARAGTDDAPLLEQETAARMLQVQSPAEHQGIGFMVRQQGPQAMFGHGGGNQGFLSDARHLRMGEQSFAYVVMINGENPDALRQVVRALMGAGSGR